MTKKILVLDFETKDPYIGMGLGSGWVYYYHHRDKSLFKVLGMAYKSLGEDSIGWTDDHKEIVSLVQEQDVLVAHNADYDIGILKAIFHHNSIPWDADKLIIDTVIWAKLHDSSLSSYSLDYLSKKYLGQRKTSDSLALSAFRSGCYPWLKAELEEKRKAEKNGITYVREVRDRNKLEKWTKENMDIVYENCRYQLIDYARRDVDLCYKLMQYLSPKIDKELKHRYSDLCHVLLDYRTKGVRVDLKRAREVGEIFKAKIKASEESLYRSAGETFNINSIKDVPRILNDVFKIKCEVTEKGNLSATKQWLESQSHPVCKQLVETRKLNKLYNDFVVKILEMQEYTCPGATDYGMVYPSLKALGAVTGRFSCSSPNVQQIPSRDKELAPLCKSIFIPFEGEKWYSLDFSSQEVRIAVHLAHGIGAEGSDLIRLEYVNNPNLDVHQMGADIAGITRSEAKGITLGIMYGMGIKKLAGQLSLSVEQAKILKDRYKNTFPWIFAVSDFYTKEIKENKYVKTIGNRLLKLDKPIAEKDSDGTLKVITFEYKALNKVIQGSAADQTTLAMISAWKMGLPVLFPVHDSIEMSSSNPNDVLVLKNIMENALPMDVPSVAEGKLQGCDSWGDVK